MDSDFRLPSDIRDPFADDDGALRPIDPGSPGGEPAAEATEPPRPIDTEYPGAGIETPSSTGGDDEGGDGGFVSPPETRDPFAE